MFNHLPYYCSKVCRWELGEEVPPGVDFISSFRCGDGDLVVPWVTESVDVTEYGRGVCWDSLVWVGEIPESGLLSEVCVLPSGWEVCVARPPLTTIRMSVGFEPRTSGSTVRCSTTRVPCQKSDAYMTILVVIYSRYSLGTPLGNLSTGNVLARHRITMTPPG